MGRQQSPPRPVGELGVLKMADAVAEQQRQIDRIHNAKNHYEVLNLTFGDSTAFTNEEFEKQYKQLARRLHPDKCALPGAEEAFKSIKLALDTLLDPEKKRKNDTLIRLHGKFRGDLDSNMDLSDMGEEVGDLLRTKPENGYTGALKDFTLVIVTIVLAYHYTRFQAELREAQQMNKGGSPPVMVLMAIVCGFALGWTYWEIFRWCSALYYGWTLCHMIPWNVVLVWQTQNATTLLGVPCWTALLVTFAGYFWLGYDVISSVLLGVCEGLMLGISCLRHSSPTPMLGFGGGYLVVVAMADVDGGVAATIAVLIFYFGSKEAGVKTYVSLALLIVYISFRINPCLCILLLFLCTVRVEDVELMSILSTVICLLTYWCAGLYWVGFTLAEGVLCKWADGQLWPDKGFGQKRLIACLAVFAVTHGIGGSTIFSAICLGCMCFGLCSGFMMLIQYENESSGPETEHRKQAETAKRDKKDAKKAEKKEQKRQKKKK